MKAAKSKLKIRTNNKSYNLSDSPLYKLKSKKRLEKILHKSVQELVNLSVEDGNYTVFDDAQKPGKPRKIQKPNSKLDVVHTRIASLLSRVVTPDYLHSGKKKHSNVTNAQVHLSSSILLTTDVKSFFPSTSRKMVFSFFYSVMQCSADIADILAGISTYYNQVPTGSRISMPLAFWANIRMFNELHALSKKHSVQMTVYVDDVTFSGDQVNKLFRSCVNKIISKHGHTMHPSKTILYKPAQAKLVTGVIICRHEMKVRNEQHHLFSCEMEQWKAIKDIPTASQASTTSRLLGRLYSMGVIDPKYSSKAKTVKSSTC